MSKRAAHIATLAMLLAPLYVASQVAFSAPPVIPADDVSAVIASMPRNERHQSLSFYFQNIEVRSLLQLIAKSSGLNFIISESVKGNVTLNLKNVTWQQALSVILKTQGLASRQVGNVIYIGTIEEITTNETRLFTSEDTIANIKPLQSTLISLRYATAKDIADVLKGANSNLLSARGQVAIDSRTNSLIVRDTKENLRGIIPEIKKLDIPAKQVLIEARIVNIDIEYEEQLGVRFGLSNTTSLSGNLNGANQLAQGTNVANVTPLTDRLNFNAPAAALFDGAGAGTVGLALAHLGAVYLDLELSALEGERHAKVIARPRVVTSNQQKAVIQAGEEIPYQESASSGATTVVFKKAVLSLEITPQITPNNKVVLVLKATQDRRGQNITIGTGTNGLPVTIPAIDTQEVQSNVLLNDNETIVVGGIYREERTNSMDRIPFFGTLPIVGNFFSRKGIRNVKRELLIFITPKIINAKSRLAEAKEQVPEESRKGAG